MMSVLFTYWSQPQTLWFSPKRATFIDLTSSSLSGLSTERAFRICRRYSEHSWIQCSPIPSTFRTV